MLDWQLYTTPPTKNASIKWTIQVKPLKKYNLCWTGRFIPRPVGSRTYNEVDGEGYNGEVQREGHNEKMRHVTLIVFNVL